MILQKNNLKKLRINYESTRNCNLKCKYCMNCVDRIRTHDGNTETEAIFLKRIKEYIYTNFNESNEYPILINLSGGEPLINKNIIQLSKEFLDIGCMVTLDTDFALNIPEEQLKGIRELLTNDRFYLLITHHEKSPTEIFRKNISSVIDLKRDIVGNENRYYSTEYQNIQFFYLNWWEDRDEQLDHFKYLRNIGVNLDEIRFLDFYSYRKKPNQENFNDSYNLFNDIDFNYNGPKEFLLDNNFITHRQFFEMELNKIAKNGNCKCIQGNYHLNYYGNLCIDCGSNVNGDLGNINNIPIPTPVLRICNVENCTSSGAYEQCKTI